MPLPYEKLPEAFRDLLAKLIVGDTALHDRLYLGTYNEGEYNKRIQDLATLKKKLSESTTENGERRPATHTEIALNCWINSQAQLAENDKINSDEQSMLMSKDLREYYTRRFFTGGQTF